MGSAISSNTNDIQMACAVTQADNLPRLSRPLYLGFTLNKSVHEIQIWVHYIARGQAINIEKSSKF